MNKSLLKKTKAFDRISLTIPIVILSIILFFSATPISADESGIYAQVKYFTNPYNNNTYASWRIHPDSTSPMNMTVYSPIGGANYTLIGAGAWTEWTGWWPVPVHVVLECNGIVCNFDF